MEIPHAHSTIWWYGQLGFQWIEREQSDGIETGEGAIVEDEQLRGAYTTIGRIESIVGGRWSIIMKRDEDGEEKGDCRFCFMYNCDLMDASVYLYEFCGYVYIDGCCGNVNKYNRLIIVCVFFCFW